MLRLEMSPLHSHKEACGFPGAYSAWDICESEEDMWPYYLTCISYRLSRVTLLRKVSAIIGVNLSTLPRRTQIEILLFGRAGLSDEKNYQILKATTDYTVGSRTHCAGTGSRGHKNIAKPKLVFLATTTI